MVTIEQIDEFRKRTHSSYEDAKFFLERNNGDILDAIIDFERTKSGRCAGGPRGRYYDNSGRRFSDIIQKGFDTRIFIEDKNAPLFSIPVIFLFFFIPFWVFAALGFLFLALLGYKFSIRDVKSQSVNVDSVFNSIHEKMKENTQTRKPPQPYQQRPAQESKAQYPVVSDLTPPDRVQKPGEDPNKDEGYKEYTIE
jgi:hypothetical protein